MKNIKVFVNFFQKVAGFGTESQGFQGLGRSPKVLKTLALTLILAPALFSGCTDDIDIPLPLATASPPRPAPVETAALQEPPEPESLVPRPGGTLRLSMRAPMTLNPLLNEDVTVARVLQLMFEPLIAFDEELRPIPHLASLEFSFTGGAAVVTIRDDALWSDGEPVTADDLIHSIQTLQSAPDEVIYKRNVENFSYVEKLDERSVRITFETISGGAAYMFNFPITPRHHFDDMAPVGNGPFKFDSFTETLRLVRCSNTFRSRPYIDEIHVLITPDAETDLHAFDRGLTDIYKATVPDWARHHSVKPVRFAEHLAMHYEFIGFNFSRDIPRLHALRQAVAHTIDVQTLISDIFLTHAMPASSPIHPASWLYDRDHGYDHGYNEANISAHGYDMELAQFFATQVLRENLWPIGEEQTEGQASDGEEIQWVELPLTVLVNEENVERILIARTIVNQMNSIGLFAELVALPFDDFYWHLQNGYFDLFVGGYNLSLQPDLRFAFHSESAENFLSYNDPEFDRLLEAAAVSGTDSGFFRTISDIQLHMARELPVISLAFRHSAVVADRRVQGDLRPGPDNIFINVHEWFVVAD